MTSNANRARPARMALQARFFRVVNVPMRVLLALPFPTPLSRRLMLVHHIGRTTGKHYRQPVSYVRDGEVLLTPGGGRWTRNLHDGQPVRITVRGRDATGRPELVEDPAEVERLLGVMAAANPALERFVPIPRTADGRLDPVSLSRAVRQGFRIVKWHVDRPHEDGRRP